MARKPRLQVPGGYYHVCTRSIDGRRILRRDWARRLLLAFVAESVGRCGWNCIAFVVMGTHYHVLFQAPEANIAVGMHHINGRFAQIFNQRHERTGHVFEHRYRSALLETDAHLLEALRYVVLNPVRAGLCRVPEEWLWGSHRAMVGLEPAPPFLAVEHVLGLFGGDPRSATAAYLDFVAEGIERDELRAV